MKQRDLEAEFEKYHREHPEVYQHFKRFADQAINAGYDRFSARTILHRVRWETNVIRSNGQHFKINDHHSPYYARLWLSEHPQHPNFFELREKVLEPDPA